MDGAKNLKTNGYLVGRELGPNPELLDHLGTTNYTNRWNSDINGRTYHEMSFYATFLVYMACLHQESSN